MFDLGGLFKKDNRGVYTDLIAPFCVEMKAADFVDFKVITLYAKILRRCYAKSSGLSDEQATNLWDSVDLGDAQHGIINKVSFAMAKKKELILFKDGGIVREAEQAEADQIKKDYEERGRSDKGVYLNFKKYAMTDVLRLYMAFIFEIIRGAWVNVNLTKALQLKIADARKTIAASDAADPMQVASNVVSALKDGKSVFLDAGDDVKTTELQTQAIKDALSLVYGLLAGELGVSTSFICGELTSGMAVTGEADVNANEDGIKDFFNSVFKPIIDKLFGVSLKFKSDNWRRIKEFAQIIPFVETSEYIDDAKKRELLERLFE